MSVAFQLFHEHELNYKHVLLTVNDQISARGAYLEIWLLHRVLIRQGRLIQQGRLLNFAYKK